MKTQKMLLTLVSMFFLSVWSLPVSAYTEGQLIVHLEQAGPQTLDLNVANLQKRRTKIAITDLHGKTWFMEYVNKHNGYGRKLNLSEMPEGDYLLFVENKADFYACAFSIYGRELNLTKTEPAAISGPAQFTANQPETGNLITRISQEGPMVLGLQLANLNQQEVKIRITQIPGMVVWQETFDGEMGYAKRINLEGVDRGIYYLVIETVEQTEICFLRISSSGIQEGRRMVLPHSQTKSDLAGN